MSAPITLFYSSTDPLYLSENKTETDILIALKSDVLTADEIASAAGIDKAQVAKRLKTMVDMGLVALYEPNKGDERYYGTKYRLIAETEDPMSDADKYINTLINGSFTGKYGFHYVVGQCAKVVLRKYGLNAREGTTAFKDRMGKAFADKIDAKNNREKLAGSIEDFLMSVGAVTSIKVTDNGDVIDVAVTPNDTTLEKKMLKQHSIIEGFVKGAYERATGKLGVVTETDDDEKNYDFRLTLRDHVRKISSLGDYTMIKKDLHWSYFLIYHDGSGLKVMKDKVKGRILAHMNYGPHSVYDMAEHIGEDVSSVEQAMREMNNEGLLEIVSSNYFGLETYDLAKDCVPLIRSRVPDRSIFDYSEDLINKFLSKKYDYDHVFMWEFQALGLFSGLDYSPALRQIGYNVGSKIAEQCRPDDFMDVVKHINGYFNPLNMGYFRASLGRTLLITLTDDNLAFSPPPVFHNKFCAFVLMTVFSANSQVTVFAKAIPQTNPNSLVMEFTFAPPS